MSAYLPTRSGATNEFKEALDLLDATLGLYGLDNDVYILGDLNADLGTEGGPQACTPHRIVGIQLLTAGRPTCLLLAYLPIRSGATDEFKEALDLLDATLGLYGLDNDVYILGDLNADLGTEGGPQACTPHRIVGIQLLTAGRPTCLLLAYLPIRSGATDEFKEALDLLDATLGLYGRIFIFFLDALST